MRVIYHPDAEMEMVQAALYYQSRQAELGSDFLGEIAIASILEDPFRLPIVEHEIRRQFVRRFPYELYFRVLNDELRVLAVKHHARDPSYWKTRH